MNPDKKPHSPIHPEGLDKLVTINSLWPNDPIWQHRSGSTLAQVKAFYGIYLTLNTLRPRQNGRHFADDTFKCIFLNENVWIPITIWLEFVPRGPINNVPALVQIMAWRRSGDKPLSEPMMVSLPTHICVTRPQWVKQQLRKCSWT